MKKYLIISFLIINGSLLFSQALTWVTSSDTLYNYSFSLPGTPVISDTLNIKHYFTQSDSIGFQVLVFKSPLLDSSNVPFTNMLQTTSGDTLLAMTNQIMINGNTTLISYQHLARVNGYTVLEANVRSNSTMNGKHVLNFARFYFKNAVLFTFSISGYDTDINNITNNKTIFFNSINL